jgi:glutaredoxin 3
MATVTVYTTNSCPYCRQAEAFLTNKGVAFQNIDVSDDGETRLKLVELSGGRKTVPQIFIGAEPIGGYTDMIALDRAGKLEPLLKAP